MAVTIDQKKLVNKILKAFIDDGMIDAFENLLANMACDILAAETGTRTGRPDWTKDGVDLWPVQELAWNTAYEIIRKWLKANKKTLKL